jgi:acyl carrier protein
LEAIVTDRPGSPASEEGNASTTGTAEEVRDAIVGCIAEFGEIEPDEVELSSSLETLDIDSLDLVEMGQILEERFKIVIEPDHMKDVATVGEAIDAVVALLPA